MNKIDLGSLVLYDGFNQYPELVPGNIYCVDRVLGGYVRLTEHRDNWYEESLFSVYSERDSFQDYDKSERDWSIPELGDKASTTPPHSLRLRRLNCLRDETKLKYINIADIQWMGWDRDPSELFMNCWCCGGERVEYADLSYPGIVLDGTTTYSGRKYRSMDGTHRIQKLIHYGYKKALVYVFHIDEVKDYFTPHGTLGSPIG